MEATLETVLKSIAHPGVITSAGGLTDLPLPPTQDSPMDGGRDAGPSSGVPRVHYATTNPHAHGIPGAHQSVDIEGRAEYHPLPWSSGVKVPRDLPHEPRLHSLPDNVLNPLGLLAEYVARRGNGGDGLLTKFRRASLQNTRKRSGLSLNDVLEASRGAVDESESPDRKRVKLGVANAGYFQPGPMNSSSFPPRTSSPSFIE